MAENKVKVIKKVDREQKEDYKRQHEIALLNLLIPEYPEKVIEILNQLGLNISLAK